VREWRKNEVSLRRESKEQSRRRRTNLDHARLSNNALEVNSVDQRLSESDLLDAGVVESVDVVPD